MSPLIVKPDWSREGRDWPNREASRFVEAGGLSWHVQVMGSGPALLLLHGAGAATHSWRDLAPRLAERFTVVAPDLPGHGFTETPRAEGLSLPGMAEGVSALCGVLGVVPTATVGHSAGAALALHLQLEGGLPPGPVVSFNGALQPFAGAAGHIFPVLAQMIFLNPLAIQMFAWRARRPGAAARLIASTGSRIDPRGLACYEALFATSGHVAGALGMMARWDLHALEPRLADLAVPLTLVAADHDLAIPPRVAEATHGRVPNSRLVRLPRLGHLAHEEAPGEAAALVAEALEA